MRRRSTRGRFLLRNQCRRGLAYHPYFKRPDEQRRQGIMRIEAILSGTISFIFNNFKGDASFHDVVKTGPGKRIYTEPDPRDDLRGTDFMRKILILSPRCRLCKLEVADVEIENILPQACLDAQTVEDFYAALESRGCFFRQPETCRPKLKSGKVLRYIGKLDNGKAAITLQMVDENHPFFTPCRAVTILYPSQPTGIRNARWW